MRSSNRLNILSVLFVLGAGLPLAACGGNAPPPAVAAPPPPAPPASANPAPAPAPPPAPVASVAPEAPAAPKPALDHHRHPVLALFVASLDSLQLSADQKATIDPIRVDLAKHAEVAKEPREKLEGDVAAGVSAGKLDQAKIDADIRAMSAAVAATQPAIQDDMNRLHKALTPEQRKKLIETTREKGKQMHEHGMAMHEHGMGMHEHGMGMHEHGMGKPEQEMGKPEQGKPEPGKTAPKPEPGKPEPAKLEPAKLEPAKPGHDHGGEGMWEGPLNKLSEELSLTPEQNKKIRAKVEALMKAQHAAMKGKMEATMKHMAAVGAAFESDQFDAKKAGVGTETPDLVSSIASERVKFVQAVLSELTPEQRPKFLAHIQAHNAEME